ncbi:LytR family transcriptional regulator, partial [Streptomyces sp. NPDC127190]
MSDPWDGPVGQTTRSRTAQMPEQRTAGPGEARPTGGREAVRPAVGGRAAAREAARSRGGRGRGRAAARRRARPAGRGRRVLKIVGICTALLVLATAGVGWWFYQHLNGNIHSVALDGKGGTEKADAFGRTPINIL